MPRKEQKTRSDELEDEANDEALAARDYVMARLGGAIASLDAAREATSAVLALFVNPDEDNRGKDRKELLDDAQEAVGAASRGIDAAVEEIDEVDFAAAEPWEDEDDDK